MHRAESLAGLLRARLGDDRVELLVIAHRLHASQRRHRFVQLCPHQLRSRLPIERLATGQHLEQHQAERVDVGTCVDRAARDLLRRHVARGSDAASFDREPGRCLVGHPRDAEVEHLDVQPRQIAPHADVLGLDVAMNDALVVCVGERLGDLERDGEGFVVGKRTVAVEQRGEIVAFDELEDEIETPVFVLAGVEELRCARMRDLQCQRGLALETPTQVRVVGQLRRQELDGDLVADVHLPREVHRPHAATADLAHDLIAAGDGPRMVLIG